MWPSEQDLEPLDTIIDGMNPMAEYPYPMKSSKNDGYPRSVGDPWIGAYTNNGYWYKLAIGGQKEWDEIVIEMKQRNDFLLDEKSYKIFENCWKIDEEYEPIRLVVAKNIRGEVLGSIMISQTSQNYSMIGAHFVVEEFRHVGIGKTLMNEARKMANGDVAMNIISHKIPKVSKISMETRLMRKFNRVRVINPNGFDSLSKKMSIDIKNSSQIEADDWNKISVFCEKCCTEKRNWEAYNDDGSEVFAAFKNNECVGLGVRREIVSEDSSIPDLLVSPLYAESSRIAESLLKSLFQKYYNPEHDFDFDVDEYAIYRRTVNFYILSESDSMFFPILKTFCGKDGRIEKDRLWYQTCSNFQLPPITHSLIYSMSDPHSFIA